MAPLLDRFREPEKLPPEDDRKAKEFAEAAAARVRVSMAWIRNKDFSQIEPTKVRIDQERAQVVLNSMKYYLQSELHAAFGFEERKKNLRELRREIVNDRTLSREEREKKLRPVDRGLRATNQMQTMFGFMFSGATHTGDLLPEEVGHELDYLASAFLSFVPLIQDARDYLRVEFLQEDDAGGFTDALLGFGFPALREPWPRELPPGPAEVPDVRGDGQGADAPGVPDVRELRG